MADVFINLHQISQESPLWIKLSSLSSSFKTDIHFKEIKIINPIGSQACCTKPNEYASKTQAESLRLGETACRKTVGHDIATDDSTICQTSSSVEGKRIVRYHTLAGEDRSVDFVIRKFTCWRSRHKLHLVSLYHVYNSQRNGKW